jgi:hypothetical protein
MQPQHHHSYSLSSFELWCIALGSLAVLIAGNARALLGRYGLLNSSQVVGQQLSGRLTSGLGTLDSFSITPGLVTLIVWGGVGMAIFSLTQAILRASATVSFQRQLGSNRFVHPSNFNRRDYWRQVLTHTVVSFGLLALLVLVAGLYLLFVAPVSFYYSQAFLLDISLAHLPSLALGLFTVFAGTAALYGAAKLVRWQQR